MYCIIKGNRIIKRFDNLEKAHRFALENSAHIKKAENLRIIRALQKIIALLIFTLAIISPRILFGELSFLVVLAPLAMYAFFTRELWLLEIFGKGE